MKRAAAALLTVAGLVLVLVAVMSAVLVGVDGQWQAEGHVDAGRTAVVVQPALTSVLGPRVALSVTASDARAELFVGRTRPDDARALLAGTAHADVRGLKDSRHLDVRSVAGPTGLPPTADVDLWHQGVVGQGNARLAWKPSPGAESFVVARTDGRALPALDLVVSWSDPSWRWLPVGLGLLGLAVIGASALLRRRLRTSVVPA